MASALAIFFVFGAPGCAPPRNIKKPAEPRASNIKMKAIPMKYVMSKEDEVYRQGTEYFARSEGPVTNKKIVCVLTPIDAALNYCEICAQLF
jgi:hypothetical protein